jgi:hypothetical protein
LQVDQTGSLANHCSIDEDPRMAHDAVSKQLARKGIETACRRCGKDEWVTFSGNAILPDMADDVDMSGGGTAATVRACGHCGYIELYNPGLLHQQG